MLFFPPPRTTPLPPADARNADLLPVLMLSLFSHRPLAAWVLIDTPCLNGESEPPWRAVQHPGRPVHGDSILRHPVLEILRVFDGMASFPSFLQGVFLSRTDSSRTSSIPRLGRRDNGGKWLPRTQARPSSPTNGNEICSTSESRDSSCGGTDATLITYAVLDQQQ